MKCKWPSLLDFGRRVKKVRRTFQSICRQVTNIYRTLPTRGTSISPPVCIQHFRSPLNKEVTAVVWAAMQIKDAESYINLDRFLPSNVCVGGHEYPPPLNLPLYSQKHYIRRTWGCRVTTAILCLNWHNQNRESPVHSHASSTNQTVKLFLWTWNGLVFILMLKEIFWFALKRCVYNWVTEPPECSCQ